jgi:hypothetical protein
MWRFSICHSLRRPARVADAARPTPLALNFLLRDP